MIRALIFDSHYDSYKGVIAYVRVFEGALRRSGRDMVASERWSRLAVEAAPTWLWHASVARLGMLRDPKTASTLKAAE